MRLAILTPDPGVADYAARCREPLARYEDAFATAGVEVVGAPWTGPTPAGTDGVLPLLAWGYHLRATEWLGRLAGWRGPPLVNPAPVVAWNTRKTYLAELAKADVATVPTLFAPLADTATLAEAFDRFATDELVVKPQVSGGSHRTVRLRQGEALPGCPLPDAMIQPFLRAVLGEGELSLFYFGGRFSHAARKSAAPGDFRVQPQFGGRLIPLDPPGEAVGLAEQVLAAAPGPLTYARIDLTRAPDGRLALMELEAIEPDLYFELAPSGAPALFARAVVNAIGAG